MAATSLKEAMKSTDWWMSAARFGVLHVLCVAGFWLDLSIWDIAIVVGLYFFRMFFVTGIYHRYFSHRTFKMGRVTQFIMAFMAVSSAQKGVMWWASHHRHHHKYSDEANDVHSVRHGGFFWAHVGWIFHPDWEETDAKRVKDLARFPELVWLDENRFVPPMVLAIACTLIGGVTGLAVWFLWSTVLLWHGTFTINSLAHVWGDRRYETSDDSKNNFFLAIITLGEGWHNNHHHYQASVNQGFFWWEIDITYYVLLAMEKVGLVWDLRRPPEHVVHEQKHPVQRAIDNFKESAANVREEALANMAAARAEATTAWDEKLATWELRREGMEDRVDDYLEEFSERWDARIDDVVIAASARLEEAKTSAIGAHQGAKKAYGEMSESASEYVEELRAAARVSRAELEASLREMAEQNMPTSAPQAT
jgi:stearoyl-CoA desaturase (delta-9 desaturase)